MRGVKNLWYLLSKAQLQHDGIPSEVGIFRQDNSNFPFLVITRTNNYAHCCKACWRNPFLQGLLPSCCRKTSSHPLLSVALPDVKDVCSSSVWYTHSPTASNWDGGLSASSLLWLNDGTGKRGPYPEGLALVLQCCSKAHLWKPASLCGGMTEPHYATVAFFPFYLYSLFVSMAAIWKHLDF